MSDERTILDWVAGPGSIAPEAAGRLVEGCRVLLKGLEQRDFTSHEGIAVLAMSLGAALETSRLINAPGTNSVVALFMKMGSEIEKILRRDLEKHG